MGIGFIIIGFFFLHFHFLHIQVYNLELLTITLSLVAILLGMLYAYRYTRSKVYLIFSFVCFVMALLTLLPGARSLFLLFQTLFYTSYLLYMIKKYPDLSNIRFLKIATFIYFVMGLGKMICFTNHFYLIIIGYNIYTLFSIGVCLSALITFWYLWKIRQLTPQESRPHTTPLTIPLYQYIIVLLLSVCFLVMIQQPFVEYIYDQDKQLDVYELENNQVTIQYILD